MIETPSNPSSIFTVLMAWLNFAGRHFVLIFPLTYFHTLSSSSGDSAGNLLKINTENTKHACTSGKRAKVLLRALSRPVKSAMNKSFLLETLPLTGKNA